MPRIGHMLLSSGSAAALAGLAGLWEHGGGLPPPPVAACELTLRARLAPDDDYRRLGFTTRIEAFPFSTERYEALELTGYRHAYDGSHLSDGMLRQAAHQERELFGPLLAGRTIHEAEVTIEFEAGGGSDGRATQRARCSSYVVAQIGDNALQWHAYDIYAFVVEMTSERAHAAR